MQYKTCKVCQIKKLVTKFYKNSGFDSYRSLCKTCHSLARKERYYRDVEETRRKEREYQASKKEYRKKYRDTHKEERAEYMREYQQKNRMKLNAYQNQYFKERRLKDIKYRLNHTIRSRLQKVLSYASSYTHWENMTGYTVEELKAHLEKSFKDGMNWDNYGKWHIDHKIPVSLWNYSSYKNNEFKQCWALANLQPLWASENCKKHTEVEHFAL